MNICRDPGWSDNVAEHRNAAEKVRGRADAITTEHCLVTCIKVMILQKMLSCNRDFPPIDARELYI